MYLVLVLAILSAAAHADPFDFRVTQGELVDSHASAPSHEAGLPDLRSLPLVGRRFQLDSSVGARSSASDTVFLSAARPMTNQRQVVIGGFLKLPLATDRKSFLDALR